LPLSGTKYTSTLPPVRHAATAGRRPARRRSSLRGFTSSTRAWSSTTRGLTPQAAMPKVYGAT
ncbi:hypothetical protein BgiMline_006455, partial [Biomphalaria glabrata]